MVVSVCKGNIKVISVLGIKIGGGYEAPSKKVKNEECVLCGCDTGILESVPVQDRKYYVHGCGQLCESCYQSLECERKFVE